MWWWKKKEAKAAAEATRKDRGHLAEKLIELDRERSHLEKLMQGMLEKREGKDA